MPVPKANWSMRKARVLVKLMPGTASTRESQQFCCVLVGIGLCTQPPQIKEHGYHRQATTVKVKHILNHRSILLILNRRIRGMQFLLSRYDF
jgi:hypothetical protein